MSEGDFGIYRKFRKSMLNFKQSVGKARMYYETESERDLLGRRVDELVEEIENIKFTQRDITVLLGRVLKFVKRVDIERQPVETPPTTFREDTPQTEEP